ncbi:MAG TPA: archaeosortase/exosortase family protein [Candidatus Limnocylindrales bacterium]|nr:archaeosortase/exosortase family protein [Candidatus Limnocylindrales bacterium]
MMAIAQLGPARHQLPWWSGRAALFALAVVAAYWLSLGTLWSDLGGQTPLAFVGLAPFLAFGLLLAGLRRRETLPFPGRVDLILGLILIGLAGAIVLAGPTLASIYFWTARLDVASLPLFAAGALILLFGWRVLFVARGAILLLLMAWPLPYLVLLENTSEAMTTVTAAALSVVTAIVPIAAPIAGGNAMFTVNHAADPFTVQVASACAGLNSTVAFGLVGGAFVLALRGAWPRKLAWFLTGLALVFLLNVVRVVLLVAVGAMFGQAAALELFHPVAGIVALIVGLIAMLVLLPRFGLTTPDLRPGPPSASPLPTRPALTPTRREMLARVGALSLAALMFGAVNATFAAYGGSAPTIDPVRPLTGTLDEIAGRPVQSQDEIAIGKPYYGADSTWMRYRVTPGPDAPPELGYMLTVDSVTASDRGGFVDFGVEKCYRFHGHSIDAAETLALGHGVVGNAIAVTRTNGMTWVVLWWEWPVEQAGVTRHERITLLATGHVPGSAVKAGSDVGSPIVFDLGTPIPEALKPLAADMTSVARQIVSDQTVRTASR